MTRHHNFACLEICVCKMPCQMNSGGANGAAIGTPRTTRAFSVSVGNHNHVVVQVDNLGKEHCTRQKKLFSTIPITSKYSEYFRIQEKLSLRFSGNCSS